LFPFQHSSRLVVEDVNCLAQSIVMASGPSARHLELVINLITVDRPRRAPGGRLRCGKQGNCHRRPRQGTKGDLSPCSVCRRSRQEGYPCEILPYTTHDVLLPSSAQPHHPPRYHMDTWQDRLSTVEVGRKDGEAAVHARQCSARSSVWPPCEMWPSQFTSASATRPWYSTVSSSDQLSLG
jgi:hypothetical protein